jgi:hypothetical protein
MTNLKKLALRSGMNAVKSSTYGIIIIALAFILYGWVGLTIAILADVCVCLTAEGMLRSMGAEPIPVTEII